MTAKEKIRNEFADMGLHIEEWVITEMVEKNRRSRQAKEETDKNEESKRGELFNLLFDTGPDIYVTDVLRFKEKLGLSKDFGNITKFFWDFIGFEFDEGTDIFNVWVDFDTMQSYLIENQIKLAESITPVYQERMKEYQIKTLFEGGNNLVLFIERTEPLVEEIRRELGQNKPMKLLKSRIKLILEKEL